MIKYLVISYFLTAEKIDLLFFFLVYVSFYFKVTPYNIRRSNIKYNVCFLVLLEKLELEIALESIELHTPSMTNRSVSKVMSS